MASETTKRTIKKKDEDLEKRKSAKKADKKQDYKREKTEVKKEEDTPKGLVQIQTTINGEEKQFLVPGGMMLSEMLRKEGYFSVKKGCSEGTCGACTVLIDGKAYNSCITFAVKIHGRKVLTVEGLGSIDNPHPLQTAFVEEGATQCGYCNPGSLLSAKALLDVNPHPTEEEVRIALDGNLCRCTGYVKRIKAVMKAAEVLRKAKKKSECKKESLAGGEGQ